MLFLELYYFCTSWKLKSTRAVKLSSLKTSFLWVMAGLLQKQKCR